MKYCVWTDTAEIMVPVSFSQLAVEDLTEHSIPNAVASPFHALFLLFITSSQN